MYLLGACAGRFLPLDNQMSFLKKPIEEIAVCNACGFKNPTPSERCRGCKQMPKLTVAPDALLDTTPIGTAEVGADIRSRHENQIEKNSFPALLGPTTRKRILAAAIDHAAIGLLTFGLAYPLFYAAAYSMLTSHPDRFLPYGLTYTPNPALVIPAAGLLFGIVSFPFLYFAYFESSKMQATPGKKLVGLKNVRTDGGLVQFKQALQKSVLQNFMLYLISLCAALPVALLLFFVSSNITGSQAYLGIAGNLAYFGIEFIFVSAVMCLPLFNHRTQSLLDKIVGRLVVPDTMSGASLLANNEIPRTGPWQKTGIIRAIIYWIGFSLVFLLALALAYLLSGGKHHEIILGSALLFILAIVAWESNNATCLKLLKAALCTTLVVGISAGLAIVIPFDLAVIQKANASIPLAQRAFKLDPKGVSPEARVHIKKAQEVFPDLWCVYVLHAGALKAFGFEEDGRELKYQALVLGAHPDGASFMRQKYPVITRETRKQFEEDEKRLTNKAND